VAAESLCTRFSLAGEGRTLVRAVVLSTLVLFLGIHRAWLHDRVGLEWVGFGAITPTVLLAGSVLPAGLKPLPSLVLGGMWPIYTAWRFLPDRGQSGPWWALAPGLKRALVPLAVLGVASALMPGCRRANSTVAHAPPRHTRGGIVGVVPGRPVLPAHHDEIPI